jgi:hypothetical protein
MRGGMNKDVRANPRVGKDEADGVVDVPGGELVGIEEQWSNRQAGGVGAGALISTSRRRINSVEIPHSDKCCRKNILRVVGGIGLVELAVAAVDNDERAVIL